MRQIFPDCQTTCKNKYVKHWPHKISKHELAYDPSHCATIISYRWRIALLSNEIAYTNLSARAVATWTRLLQETIHQLIVYH